MRIFGMRAWIFVLIALLWLLYIAGMFLSQKTHPAGSIDFTAYYNASVALANDEPMYSGIMGYLPYLYPPILAQLLYPIATNMDVDAAGNLWYGFSIVLTLASLILLSPYVPARLRAAFWISPVLFTPLLNTLLLGQVTALLFFLTAAAWVSIKQERHILAGVLLAAAAWLKVYPAIIILYFIWKRDGRFVLGVAISGILLGIIQLVGAGWENFYAYFADTLPELSAHGQIAIASSNHSVNGFAQRMFGDVPYVKSLFYSSALVTITRWGILAFLIGITIWLTRKPQTAQQTSPAQFDLEYGMVLIVALVFSASLTPSTVLSVYMVFLLIARNIPEKMYLPMVALLGIAFFLITIHFSIVINFLESDTKETMPGIFLSGPFFGMMLLWGICAYLLYLRRTNKIIDEPAETPSTEYAVAGRQ